ncbi:MAG: type IV toxin-antitoxin system AbiEi family antitoxin [Bryobacteraceae bacterium]
MRTREAPLLQAALAALRRTTGLAARVLKRELPIRQGRSDALVEVAAGRRRHRFIAEVKAVDRFETPAQVKRQLAGSGAAPMLVAPYVSGEIAEYCRDLGLAFVDTAGNAYLERPGLLVWVAGQKRPTETMQSRFRALKPAGLRVAFALLCHPELIGTNYRELARAAEVGLGTVGPAIEDLKERGFVQWRGGAVRRILDPRRLLEEWVTHYHTTLRPKLHPRRFDAGTDTIEKVDLKPYGAYWGGEVAADRLVHALKPATFTIYAREPLAGLAAALRLRARPGGPVEILDAFWDFAPELGHPNVAPPVLAYADLLATRNGRSIEAASLIHERYIEPSFRRAG